MQDRLAPLLQRFEIRARVFHSGTLCTHETFPADAGHGYLHVLRRGSLRVSSPGHVVETLQAPALLLYLAPCEHALLPDGTEGCDLVCGEIEFGTAGDNPLARALAQPVIVDLRRHGPIAELAGLLFREAGGNACGRQATLDRLCELLLIQLLRDALAADHLDVGLLAGLSDERLARALNAVHAHPDRPWTLDTLAAEAGMSRARFAARFRVTVGITAGEYLSAWRLGLAARLLRQDRPVGWIASEVGYASGAALARAFSRRYGMSPSDWRRTRIGTAHCTPDC